MNIYVLCVKAVKFIGWYNKNMHNKEEDLIDNIGRSFISSPNVEIKLLNGEGRLPTRENISDAGADLYSTDIVRLEPGERAIVKTGIAIQNKYENTYFRIAPRSGLALSHGIHVLGGVCDQDYIGEIKVIVINLSKEFVVLDKGTKIAQIIMERIYTPTFVLTDKLIETDRSDKGFGSTDKKIIGGKSINE